MDLHRAKQLAGLIPLYEQLLLEGDLPASETLKMLEKALAGKYLMSGSTQLKITEVKHIRNDDYRIFVDGIEEVPDRFDPDKKVIAHPYGDKDVIKQLKKLTAARTKISWTERGMQSKMHLSVEITSPEVKDVHIFDEFPASSTSSWVNISKVRIDSLEGIGTKHLTSIGPDGELLISKKIKSNILGLLKIKNLKIVLIDGTPKPDLEKAVKIINKHLASGRNIRKCKAELEDTGLDDYAQL